METQKTDIKQLCTTLYIIFALSSILQFSEITLIPGILALLIAYALVVMKKKEAEGTPFASHFRWLARTFWIGAGVIVPVAIVLAMVLILTLTDIATVTNAMRSDDPDMMMTGMQSYIEGNMTKIWFITFVTMAPTTVWWLRRCWVGYKLAKEDKPVENVTSWL